MTLDNQSKNLYHWDDMSQLWSLLGPPLKPSKPDLTFLNSIIAELNISKRPLNSLILGVTPEYYTLNWPEHTDLLAIDRSSEMIASVWPGHPDQAIQGNWTTLPCSESSKDIIICDGGFNSLAYKKSQSILINSIRSILRPGGILCIRLFMLPENRESPEQVIDDLHKGKIANLNILKLRLGMALQREQSEGIELDKLWQYFNDAVGNLDSFARKIGWSVPHIHAINAYKGSRNKYYFMTLDDLLLLFQENKEEFNLETVFWPDYELGERCPTIVLKKI